MDDQNSVDPNNNSESDEVSITLDLTMTTYTRICQYSFVTICHDVSQTTNTFYCLLFGFRFEHCL